MKKIMVFIICLCCLFVVGCNTNNNSEEIVFNRQSEEKTIMYFEDSKLVKIELIIEVVSDKLAQTTVAYYKMMGSETYSNVISQKNKIILTYSESYMDIYKSLSKEQIILKMKQEGWIR